MREKLYLMKLEMILQFFEIINMRTINSFNKVWD